MNFSWIWNISWANWRAVHNFERNQITLSIWTGQKKNQRAYRYTLLVTEGYVRSTRITFATWVPYFANGMQKKKEEPNGEKPKNSIKRQVVTIRHQKNYRGEGWNVSPWCPCVHLNLGMRGVNTKQATTGFARNRSSQTVGALEYSVRNYFSDRMASASMIIHAWLMLLPSSWVDGEWKIWTTIHSD